MGLIKSYVWVKVCRALEHIRKFDFILKSDGKKPFQGLQQVVIWNNILVVEREVNELFLNVERRIARTW